MKSVNLFKLVLVFTVILKYKYIFVDGFDLTILHTNDIHSRIEQFNKYGSGCSADDSEAKKCYGGVARLKTKVSEIKNEDGPNVVVMDAGDQFLGSLWFTHYSGMAASFFMKEIGYNIMCLGNHEFDIGVQGLVDFLDNITFPVVSANTDVSVEPRLQGKFDKSTVLTVGGEQIGVVGYITQETYLISNGGPTVVFDDEIASVQTEVMNLQKQGVNKIIALGHAGFTMDLRIAEIEGIDVVIGGHTNTFLYKGEKPSNEQIQGPYPTVVTKTSGKKALVVQDYTWGKYLGNLKVTFDDSGDVTTYSGNPILLNSMVAEDTEVKEYVSQWAVPLEKFIGEEVGKAGVFINGSRWACRLRECAMGNLLTDAIIDYHKNFTHSNTSWAPASIALWNGGGIRSSIGQGTVTVGNVMQVLPFGNEMDLIIVTGSNLKQQLEHSVSDWNPSEPEGRFLQFSGLIVIYNLTEPVGERVHKVYTRCLACRPDQVTYAPLDDTAEYRIFTSTFLLRGGDGFGFNPISRERFNTLESEVLIQYIKRHSPVSAKLERRIQFLTDDISSAARFVMSTSHVIVWLLLSFVIQTSNS